MTPISTVTGPVDSSRLGFTLMHEHIVVSSWAMRQSYPGWFDREIVVKQAVEGLKAARACGVQTIVDVTTSNLGRDIYILREVSEKSEVQIIASTGLFYTEEPWMNRWEADRLVEWLLHDVEQGIQGADAKAGIIKCGTDKLGLTPLNRKLLQVTARLHHATGLPITTHTDVTCRTGMLQQEVFAEEGVDLSRVVIGHSGDSSDLGYLEELLSRGSMIGMDRFGQLHHSPMGKRVEIVAEMCRRGWGGRMVFGHDADLYSDWSSESLDEHRRAARPLPFCRVSDEAIPALRKAGVTDEQITQMGVGNPRRIFETTRR